MTDRELKTLKDNLWHAADVLRSGAHLAANKYGQPILGLIFLRYADILFKQHKDEIDAEYTKRLGTRMEKTSKEIAVEKCGFFLPECAYYDFINDAPDTAEKADLVKKAMEAIERENPKMEGVLPKEVYAQLVPEEEPEPVPKPVEPAPAPQPTGPVEGDAAAGLTFADNGAPSQTVIPSSGKSYTVAGNVYIKNSSDYTLDPAALDGTFPAKLGSADAPQVLIPRQIGHAEAARAKTYADHIMRVKDRTDREIRAVARRLHVLLTVRAP